MEKRRSWSVLCRDDRITQPSSTQPYFTSRTQWEGFLSSLVLCRFREIFDQNKGGTIQWTLATDISQMQVVDTYIRHVRHILLIITLSYFQCVWAIIQIFHKIWEYGNRMEADVTRFRDHRGPATWKEKCQWIKREMVKNTFNDKFIPEFSKTSRFLFIISFISITTLFWLFNFYVLLIILSITKMLQLTTLSSYTLHGFLNKDYFFE